MKTKILASGSGNEIAPMVPLTGAILRSTFGDEKEVKITPIDSEIDLYKDSGTSLPRQPAVLICSQCKESLLPDSFHKNKSKKSGYESSCKNCVSEAKAKCYKMKKKSVKDREQFSSSIVGEVCEISGQEFARVIGVSIKEHFSDEFFD